MSKRERAAAAAEVASNTTTRFSGQSGNNQEE